jgi:hypothetical protein
MFSIQLSFTIILFLVHQCLQIQIDYGFFVRLYYSKVLHGS